MAYGVNGGYGGYGGYPGVGAGNMGSPQFASGIYPPGSASGSDQFVGNGIPKKKGLAGFFQGVLMGAVKTIESLFSIQGILTTAGAGALVWATGGAALIPLAALGAGMGGFQMLKGLSRGDSESVGEGFFVAATSLLGLKFTPKKVTLNGQVFTLSNGSTGQPLGVAGRLKALWGGNNFVSAGGESMNIWQMGASKLFSRFQPGSSAVTTSGAIASQGSVSDTVSLRSVSDDASSIASSKNSSTGSPKVSDTQQSLAYLTAAEDITATGSQVSGAQQSLAYFTAADDITATGSQVSGAPLPAISSVPASIKFRRPIDP